MAIEVRALPLPSSTPRPSSLCTAHPALIHPLVLPSLTLAHYLLSAHHFPPPASSAEGVQPLFPTWSTSTLLELGSGTGFLGLACRGTVHRWIYSDLGANLDLVRRNLARNGVEAGRGAMAARGEGRGAKAKESDKNRKGSKKEGEGGPEGWEREVMVEIDWMDYLPSAVDDQDRGRGRGPEQRTRVGRLPIDQRPSIILAVDTLYNPELAIAFAHALTALVQDSTYPSSPSLSDSDPRGPSFQSAGSIVGSEEEERERRRKRDRIAVLVVFELRDPEALEVFLGCMLAQEWRLVRVSFASATGGSGGQNVGWIGWRD